MFGVFFLYSHNKVCVEFVHIYLEERVCPSRSTSSSFTISNLKSVPVMAFSIISYYLIAFELCRRAGGCRGFWMFWCCSLFFRLPVCTFLLCLDKQFFAPLVIVFLPFLFSVSYVFLLLFKTMKIVKMIMVRLFGDDCLWFFFVCVSGTCSYIARMMMTTMMILMMMPIKN